MANVNRSQRFGRHTAYSNTNRHRKQRGGSGAPHPQDTTGEPVDIENLQEVLIAAQKSRDAREIIKLFDVAGVENTAIGEGREYVISINRKNQQSLSENGINSYIRNGVEYISADVLQQMLKDLIPFVQEHRNFLGETQNNMNGRARQRVQKSEKESHAVGVQECDRIISFYNKLCLGIEKSDEMISKDCGLNK